MAETAQKQQGANSLPSQTPKREIRIIQPHGAQPVDEKVLVAAYVRVSSSSDDQLNSYATQLKHYREYISEHGDWRLVDIYADEGISGTSTLKRDEFNRLMRDCRKGKIKRILTKSISRFCRNTQDCLVAVRELTALGVSVFFEKEGIDTAKMKNELFLTTLSDFAQTESLSISGNMRKGIRMRMEQGTYVTQPPLGYRLVDKKLVVDEGEAAIVRDIFTRFLTGTGSATLALQLAEAGIPSPAGNDQWSRTAVTYILSNERYIGNALYQKKYTTDTLPFKRLRNKGELDQYMVYDSHPPIIDRENFERAQALIARRREECEKQTRPPRHPFAQKIKCGACGATYRRKIASGKCYWTCRTHDKLAALCDGPRIPEDALEMAFTRMAGKLKLHQSAIIGAMLEQLYSLKRSVNLNNPQVAEFYEKILKLEEQNTVLAGLAAKGYMDAALCLEKQGANNKEIARLKGDKGRLFDTEQLDDAIERSKALGETLDGLALPLLAFDADAFGAMVQKIVVESAGEVSFHLHNGLALRENI